MNEATLAAHRFGLGEPSLSPLQADPRGWVMQQLGSPGPLDASGLESSLGMYRLGRRVVQAALQRPGSGRTDAQPPAPMGAENPSMEAPPVASASDATLGPEQRAARRALGAATLREQTRRWQHAIATPTPVAERWIGFWANHFTVAATKGATLGMVGPFEREAIRPFAFGRFADLLRAATLHPAMLLYLDNAVSFGAASPAGRRRGGGLNENLARELLELHTLGVQAGYTQADVTETARVLTGWTVARNLDAPALQALEARSSDTASLGRFVPALHDPGPKRILGRRYEEGPQAVDALLEMLADHPATARHVATQLTRHFVADDPPAALVDAVAAAYRRSEGDLTAVAQALFQHPETWRTDGPGKFKRPEEWMLSAHRVLRWPLDGPEAALRLSTPLTRMGQPPNRAPSPQGWPDRQADWLGPDALWKRIEWASQFAQGIGSRVDARAVAEASLGPALGAVTRLEIERAESPAQALTLLLASPPFLRR